MAGVSYTTGDTEFYVDYGSAFETPTTTELVNRPDLTGGFNTALKAQRTLGGEAGLRATLDEGRLRADLSVYRFVVRDRITAFQTIQGGDRTFFRNGGRDVHRGVETALVWNPAPQAEIRSVISVGRFDLKDQGVDGNRLPGVPEKQVQFSAVATPGALRATFDVRRIDSVLADDANSVRAEGYTLVGCSLSYEYALSSLATLIPFIAVSNLTDRSYVASVTINSSSGRYFDPGSGRALQVGMNLSF
jgi:iron complex outermembrane receptor protein